MRNINDILYSRQDIRRAVRHLFADSGRRRIAIVGFVGVDAAELVGNPQGLEVVCWPKAGGTHPEGIRALMRAGANVYFSDSLHMKIYWAQRRGCIIGSANLSNNALGTGTLKEIAVRLRSDALAIDRVWRQVAPAPVTADQMDRLDREHAEFVSRHPSAVPTRSRVAAPTYQEWYALPYRTRWKLGLYDWDGKIDLSAGSREACQQEYDRPEPVDWVKYEKGIFQKGDWMLMYRQNGRMPAGFVWMHAGFVRAVSKRDKTYASDYPIEIVQPLPLSRYGVPPFDVRDQVFRQAFRAAARDYGTSLEGRFRPPKKLLRLISEHYVRLVGHAS
jgi:hypothetical protein